MTLETPLYKNKKGEWVDWKKLTKEERKVIIGNEKLKTKSWLKNEIKRNKSELIKLLAAVTDASNQKAKQEIERLLNEK